MKINKFFLLFVASITFCACHSKTSTPKPKAYIRLDMVAPDYITYQNDTLPFTFEKNDAAQLLIKKNNSREVWADIIYPQFDGVVYLSYMHLNGLKDLRGQTDTSTRLLESHYQFSSGVDEEHYVSDDHRVYATTYHLRGTRVASTYQFWATDSISNFIRGALFLNHTPNNDSLAPVLEYIKGDINHLIETLDWTH